MSAISHIDVRSIVKDHKPRVEESRDISKWFKEETLELNFGDYVGRPSEKITMHKDYLAKFLENGWTIDSVRRSMAEGYWIKTEKTGSSSSSSSASNKTNSNDQTTDSSEKSSNKSNGRDTQSSSSNQVYKQDASYITDVKGGNGTTSSSQSASSDRGSSSSSSSGQTRTYGTSSSSSGSTSSSSSSSTLSDSLSWNNQTTANSSSDVHTTNNTSESSQDKNDESSANSSRSGSTHDAGSESTNSSSSSNGDQQTKTTDPYWCAYQLIRLRRRRMQPELVLQSMVSSFTDSYNNGRTIENDRYNEMIALYAVALSSTENECENLISGAMDLTPLFDQIMKSVEDSFTAASSSASEISKRSVEDALNDINRQFDALIAQAKAQMISNGTYNGTVWPTTMSGIERQRSAAIIKAQNEGSQTAVAAWANLAQVRGTVSASLLSAKQAMSDAADKRKMSSTDARNAIVKWIVDFAGQREEVYPELQEISTLTERLGFSVGSAGNIL